MRLDVYTRKQYLYASFMLKKLGIENEEKIKLYLEKLINIHGYFERYYPKPNSNKYILKFRADKCLEILKEEIELRKARITIKMVKASENITATDIGSYDFCAASYAIKRSFKIEKSDTAEAAERGSQLHEQLRILRLKSRGSKDSNILTTNADIRMIRNSQLIFYGHGKEQKKFTNEKFIGISRSLQLGDQMCGRFSTYLSEAISTPICDDLLT